MDELRERLVGAAAVDDRALTLLAAQADHVRELDRMLGARAAESQLGGHLATLDGLRRFATVGNRREALADLYADAAALAGWQALDLGALTAPWNHHEAAKDAGREGPSPAALVHAMAQQAYVLVEVGEVAHAVQLAEYARSLAQRAVPSLLRAWLWAVEGEVYAAAGDDPSCRRAFDAAERLLPQDCQDPALPYIVLDGVHLARWRGHAWARLGDVGAIEDLHTALTGLDVTFTRAKAGLHVDLAYALVAAKQASQAAEHLRQADALATRIGSTRQRRRVRRLEATLRAS